MMKPINITIHHSNLPTEYWVFYFLKNGLEAERPPVEDECQHMMRWYNSTLSPRYLLAWKALFISLNRMAIAAAQLKKAMARMSECPICDAERKPQATLSITGSKGAMITLDKLKWFKKQRVGRSRKIRNWDNQRRGQGRR